MDPFIGDIRMFAGTYAPEGFVICDGSLLNINQYNGLYSLIGTTYGGDGKTNFAVPDMRGCLPVGSGAGPGLTSRKVGDAFGAENVTLTPDNFPPHNHLLLGSQINATGKTPTLSVLGKTPAKFYDTGDPATKIVEFHPNAIAPSGSTNLTHSNIMPYLCINFIIAVEGVFPTPQQ